jgi:hypothetical protein
MPRWAHSIISRVYEVKFIDPFYLGYISEKIAPDFAPQLGD